MTLHPGCVYSCTCCLFALVRHADESMLKYLLYHCLAASHTGSIVSSCKNFRPGVACLVTQGSTVSSGVPFRANAGLTNFLTGSLMSELPPATYDVLLWFTGDDPLCTEGQLQGCWHHAARCIEHRSFAHVLSL